MDPKPFKESSPFPKETKTFLFAPAPKKIE